MKTYPALKAFVLLTIAGFVPLSLYGDDAKDMKQITPPVAAVDPITLSFFAGPYYYFTPKTPFGTEAFANPNNSSEWTQSAGPIKVDSSGLGFMVGSELRVPLHEDFADSFDPKFTFWQVENDNNLQPRPSASINNFIATQAIVVSSADNTPYTTYNGISNGSFKSTVSNADVDLLLTKKLFQADDYTLSLLYGISVGYYDNTIKENMTGDDSGLAAGETGKYDASSIRAGPSLGFTNSFKLPLDSILDFSVLARFYIGANDLSGSQSRFDQDYPPVNGSFVSGNSNVTFSPEALANLKWTLPIDTDWSFFADGTGTLFINTPATQFSEPDTYGTGSTNLNGTKFGLMSQTTYGASGDVGFKYSF